MLIFSGAGEVINDDTAIVGQPLLHTGNGSTQSITGADFSPDLVVTRRRTGTGRQARWVDNVRGVGLSVTNASTAAEITEATGVTSFDANGFSLGADTDYNESAGTYLSLVLQKVAGAFDIVTYTGTGVVRTVSHNLGVIPEFIVVFDRTTGGNQAVYAAPLSSPETKILLFQGNNAVSSCATCWNNTAPTSSVFTVGTASSMNTNGNLYVAYLFATLNPGSAVGSYTGDGATNGPTVTTGFKPKFVIIKRTDSTGGWMLFDDQRDPSSPHNTYLQFNGTAAELVTTNTAGGVDFLSNGFQSIDSDAAGINISGASYIYLAIA